MKKTLLLLFIITTVLLLTGCGGDDSDGTVVTEEEETSGVSKRKLTNDLEASEFLSSVNAKITDINIIKRRTREADYTDYIYADITSENEYFRFTHTFELNYELYDNGWVLDNMVFVISSRELLNPDECYVDEETVRADAEDWIPECMAPQDWNMRNIEITSLSLNSSFADPYQPYCVYDFTATAECDYASFEVSGSILYYLTPYDGWIYMIDTEETQITFDITEKSYPGKDGILADTEEMLYSEYNIQEYNLRNITASEPRLYVCEEITPTTNTYGSEMFYANKYGIRCMYDVVYTAENDDASFEIECLLEYFLMSDNGWEYICGYSYDPIVSPKSAPNRDKVDDDVSYFMDGDFEFVSDDWDGDTYNATYNVIDSTTYKYVTNYYSATFSYSFDPSYGWVFENYDYKITDRKFDVLGTWTYEDSENKYIINITSMTAENVFFSYDMKVTYYPWIGKNTEYDSSGGEIEQRDWEIVSNSDFCLKTTKHIVGWKTVSQPVSTHLYYLEFRSYTGSECDKSGFYIDGKQLTRS